ncbi:hypothetical protein BsIDN1_13510 [Bacillus safensis]|uniref:Major facilitator superfamily (MFS) profile domain-containing protein n=1 Tax=Bacillus safensis TaxID=561879 RepID=A0A5S9M3L8_BACIA|nr:hypothetical protein BsIDN1_13510 [Bacillus safensis]
MVSFFIFQDGTQVDFKPFGPKRKKTPAKAARSDIHRKSALIALGIIVFLIFARSWYGNAISNFYAFYAIEQYGLTIKESQTYIFLFLILGAIGTFLGGPLADRFGKKNVILVSLLASFPLALVLPFAGPVFAYVLLGLIGLILTSSFSVTVVYAQELFPGKNWHNVWFNCWACVWYGCNRIGCPRLIH